MNYSSSDCLTPIESEPLTHSGGRGVQLGKLTFLSGSPPFPGAGGPGLILQKIPVPFTYPQINHPDTFSLPDTFSDPFSDRHFFRSISTLVLGSSLKICPTRADFAYHNANLCRQLIVKRRGSALLPGRRTTLLPKCK